MILNVADHGWAAKNIFHSRSPKTVLNNILLHFYLTEEHKICILY